MNRRCRKDYGNFPDCALICASGKGETWSTDYACATFVKADFAEDRALLIKRKFHLLLSVDISVI